MRALFARWMFLLVSISLLGVTGCGSGATEDQGEVLDFPDGKMDSITPQEEENLGYLIVQEPQLNGVTKYPYFLKYRDTNIQLNTKYRLLKGPGCLKLAKEQNSGRDSDIADCDLTIEPKTTKTYLLSAIVASWKPAQFAVEVGPRPSVSINRILPDKMQKTLYEDPLDHSELTQRAYVVIGGSYNLSFYPNAINYQLSTAFDPGQVIPLSIDPSSEFRSFVRIKPPVRQALMPAEVDAKIKSGTQIQYNKHFVVWRTVAFQASALNSQFEPGLVPNSTHDSIMNDTIYRAAYIADYATFALDVETSIRMYAFVPGLDNDAYHYEYIVNNIPILLSPEQGQTQDIEGQHMDLFDAEVVKDTGETYTTKATYNIYWKSATAQWIRINPIYYTNQGYNGNARLSGLYNFSTPSGFDLVPGTYQITLQYSTQEGQKNKRYECEMITPSIPGQDRCKEIQF